MFFLAGAVAVKLLFCEIQAFLLPSVTNLDTFLEQFGGKLKVCVVKWL